MFVSGGGRAKVSAFSTHRGRTPLLGVKTNVERRVSPVTGSVKENLSRPPVKA
jgi:hypothetical protein